MYAVVHTKFDMSGTLCDVLEMAAMAALGNPALSAIAELVQAK